MLLLLTGCSDVVTEFATVADARAQGAFQRGWLPPLLPDSAVRIVERNDVDSNVGTGSFDYDLAERTAYMTALSRLGATSRMEKGIDIVTVSTNSTVWEIRLPRTSSSAKWSVKPLR